MNEDLLNPRKALIFRIMHRENLPMMLQDGLHCRSSQTARGPYVQIGNPELIAKRRARVVECPPGGTLSDYIPFYFTPRSPMLHNIKTGFNGVKRRSMSEVVVLISSLRTLSELGVPFVFSDRHAYLKFARFTCELANLNDPGWIDWSSLQAGNYRRDDVDRFDRYQAEALVHRHMPVGALLGIACYTEAVRREVEAQALHTGLDVKVVMRQEWYP